MPLRQSYVRILSRLLPAGAVGVSVLLGSTALGSASEHPAAAQPQAADKDRVSERLAAIREAVSTVSPLDEQAVNPADASRQLAWGNWWNGGGWGWGGYRPWGGYGYGWPNWNNWHNWNNWNNFWRNW